MRVKKKFNFVVFCTLNLVILCSIISMFFLIMKEDSFNEPQVQVVAKEKTPRISQLKLPLTAPSVVETENPTFEISRAKTIDEEIELSATQSTSYLLRFDEEQSIVNHNFTTSISSVSKDSLYTIIITFNGTEIYNAQHSGAVTLETLNCSADQDVKLYLINSTSKPFKADLSISNYIQEKETS